MEKSYAFATKQVALWAGFLCFIIFLVMIYPILQPPQIDEPQFFCGNVGKEMSLSSDAKYGKTLFIAAGRVGQGEVMIDGRTRLKFSIDARRGHSIRQQPPAPTSIITDAPPRAAEPTDHRRRQRIRHQDQRVELASA